MNSQRQRAAVPATETSFQSLARPLLQRKCACGGTPGPTGECEGCRKKRSSLQRHASNQDQVTTIPPLVHEVLRSPGQPLDFATRSIMEPRFGHDFSQVRIHADAKAMESARAVNALAYVVGRNVVFAENQYAPGMTDGKKLLAHELTHVVQQHKALDTLPAHLTLGPHNNRCEREAEQIASGYDAGIVNGATARPLLQRQPAPPTGEEKKKEEGGKTAVSQPAPQKIPAPQAQQAAKKDAEKKGVEGGVSVGVETETKKEDDKTKTEVAGKYTIEATIPVTEKLKVGPVTFAKEVDVEATGGLKSSSGPRSPLTNLEAQAAIKVVSVELPKVKAPLGLGIVDIGVSGSALGGIGYSPMEEKGTAKVGFGAEAEAKLKPTEKSPFFIKAKGGVEKTYDKEGNAEFTWSPLAWKTSAAVGVEF